jgi:hypothetical protein
VALPSWEPFASLVELDSLASVPSVLSVLVSKKAFTSLLLPTATVPCALVREPSAASVSVVTTLRATVPSDL